MIILIQEPDKPLIPKNNKEDNKDKIIPFEEEKMKKSENVPSARRVPKKMKKKQPSMEKRLNKPSPKKKIKEEEKEDPFDLDDFDDLMDMRFSNKKKPQVS